GPLTLSGLLNFQGFKTLASLLFGPERHRNARRRDRATDAKGCDYAGTVAEELMKSEDADMALEGLALKKEKVPLPSSIPAKSGGGTQRKMELRKAKLEGEQQFLFDQATTDKLRSESLMFKLI
ncbi:hypothetical protein HID58_092647, partial [Brassica napus]